MTAAVIYVKNLAAMATFYATCFALFIESEESEEPAFCVLASSDWELSLVRVSPAVAATIVISDPPRRREQSPLKLVFDVPDLDRAASRVLAAGGQVDPADTAWVHRGRVHRDCLDPEGNVVQLRQPAGEWFTSSPRPSRSRRIADGAWLRGRD